MTGKTQESGGISGCGGGFVPPSILEYAFVNVITGHGVPGTIVKLTDGGSLILGSATVASDASWSIPLDQPTKMYDVLRATAYNPTSEKTSAAAQVTVGGAQPEITESYAGSEGAVGMTARAARVTIYGPDGEQVGWAVPDPRDGAWLARYAAKLNAGDTVTLIANAGNGNTSVPVTLVAGRFNVTHRTGRRIGASGAEPGATIMVYNADTGQLIDEVKANADGEWSLDFHQPLARGSRVRFYAVNSQGLTTNAVTVVLSAAALAPPVIYQYSTQGVSGWAPPNKQVYILGLDTGCGKAVNVDGQGQWTTVGVKTFQENEVVFARTLDSEPNQLIRAQESDTADSSINTSVTISQYRPNPPTVEKVEEQGAEGTAEPGAFVYAATVEPFNLIGSVLVGDDGGWEIDFPNGIKNGQMIAFNAVADLNMLAGLAPDSTSNNMVHTVGEDPATEVETPVFTVYNGTVFSGTEATPNTRVVVNRDHSGEVGHAVVDADGNWEFSVSGADIVADDVQVYAIAEVLPAGKPTSQKTKLVTVDSYVPEPPDVTGPYPDVVSGTEAGPADQLPKLKIYIAYADSPDVPIGPGSPVDDEHNWEYGPAGLKIGDKMVAWAQTDAGNQSKKVPFTILGESQPLPPQIRKYNGNPVSGTTYDDEVTVSLYEDSTSGTLLGSEDLAAGVYNWSIDVGGTLPAGTKLVAIVTDALGSNSDPAVENVDMSQPNYPSVLEIQPTYVSGQGDASTIAYAYSYDTGKKLGSVTVGPTGVFEIPLSPEQLEGAYIITFLADDTTGSLSPFFVQAVGYTYS